MVAGYTVHTAFNPERVLRQTAAGQRRALVRAGALARGVAKRMFRRPRRVSLGEMTVEQRLAWDARLRRARRQGQPRPQRPWAKPKSGEPPASRSGRVKRLIKFAVEDDDVLVGPEKSGTGTVSLLEHGGTGMLPAWGGQRVPMRFHGNPFMAPTLDVVRPKLPELFRDCVR
ncbi:MAG: hypothetical protein KF774_17785 [Planctomyces sp.]|nr:hypothetical protein [Planctomyces sp.]